MWKLIFYTGAGIGAIATLSEVKQIWIVWVHYYLLFQYKYKKVIKIL